jgi:hypothetical protein
MSRSLPHALTGASFRNGVWQHLRGRPSSPVIRSPLVFFVLYFCFSTAVLSEEAMWEQLSRDQLIAASDLIGVGEVIGEAEITLSPGQQPVRLAILRIDEVLKGTKAESTVLLALPLPSAPRSSTDLLFRRGNRGLWFLRAGPPGTTGLYVADHPQRFIETDRATEELKLLRERLK